MLFLVLIILVNLLMLGFALSLFAMLIYFIMLFSLRMYYMTKVSKISKQTVEVRIENAMDEYYVKIVSSLIFAILVAGVLIFVFV